MDLRIAARPAAPQPRVRAADHAAFAFDAGTAAAPAPTRSAFLSTLAPGAGQRRGALAVVLVSLAFFLAAVPFAAMPLPVLPAFLPIYQSALVVIDLITMTLLLGQYAILRSRALLVLACAYLFGALMAIAHAASFPGLFAPAGLLGGGQATAWLYFFWHAGFPLFVAGYTVLRGRGPYARARNVAWELVAAVLATIAVAAALTIVAAHWEEWLLPLMAGDSDGSAKEVVATITWMAGVAALALLWLRRPHSVIDLWLLVVLCVWTADTALAAMFNNARFDLGWYAGRVYGLLASSFVLAVLLLENSMLYARLVEANEAQRRRSAQLKRLSTQLEAANRDLDAFAGGLAHDLQQPITSIGAFAQVIQQQSGHLIGAGNAGHLQRIIQAAGMAHRMIRSLLEFARLGEKQIQPDRVELSRVVEEARAAVASQDPAIAWSIGALPAVRGDASLLLLAVVNLLANAVKYSRGKERPAIGVQGGLDADGTPWLRITDNGVGFDMAQAARLFTPFERLHTAREFEGTGMGLANVRRIMERHGGSVTAQSRPGQGSAFTLRFPAERAQQAAAPRPGGRGATSTA